jgi:hypothetical protein
MTHQRAVSTLAAERYLLDEMSELERMAFEAHYFDCAECADDVRAGEQMRAATIQQRLEPPQAPGADVPTDEMPARARRWTTTIMPWAAAAGIALFAGYQSLFVVPALRRSDGPQALDAVTLRPASRGEEPVVRIHKGQSAVLLALDVNTPASGSEVEYELKADDNGSHFERQAPTPAAGSPLLLLMPADRLQPAQRFTIVVRDPSNPDVPLGEYHFAVASDAAS